MYWITFKCVCIISTLAQTLDHTAWDSFAQSQSGASQNLWENQSISDIDWWNRVCNIFLDLVQDSKSKIHEAWPTWCKTAAPMELMQRLLRLLSLSVWLAHRRASIIKLMNISVLIWGFKSAPFKKCMISQKFHDNNVNRFKEMFTFAIKPEKC